MSAVEKVPFLDLTTEFQELEQEWLSIIRETGARGSFILGPNVTAFEEECARYIGAKHAVAVANGTDALILSLRARGIGPGDEVITTTFTFFATSEAIGVVGATPVFADIDADTFTLDTDDIARRITDKARAIIAVHLFGSPVDMDALMPLANQHNLAVIEDCAQAFGASWENKRVGAFSYSGCFSFYPTKVLGCYGDGGMISTNSSETDEHLRRLRNHGAVRPFEHTEIGYNSRLDEIQAALLRLKLRLIEKAIAARREVANYYREELKDLPVILPAEPDKGGHVYNLFTIRLRQRDVVRQLLTDNQVASSLCYPVPLHLQAVYRQLGYQAGDLPVSEQASREVLSLPIYPGMSKVNIDRVCELIGSAVG